MASIFLRRNLSNVTNISNRTRKLSSFDKIFTSYFNDEVNLWSERNWSNIAKQFHKISEFPLPGQTGVCVVDKILTQQNPTEKSQVELNLTNKNNRIEELNRYDLLQRPLPYTKHVETLRQIETYHREMSEKFTQEEDTSPLATMKNVLDLKAYECPVSLVKDFQKIFPMTHEALTVITVCIRTQNDMSMYSAEIEDEREMLMKKYVDIAQELSTRIRRQGYWADYIDPSSGKPFNGPFTHATFYETDERYRQLGFEILDYGCCKVVSHHKWGTKSYVGSILTTISHKSRILKEILMNL